MKLPGESDVTGSAREPAHDALSGAVAARDRGDSVRAEALCREALAAHPNDAAAWAVLGTVIRKRDPDAAQAAFARVLELDPGHVEARFHLGNLYREQERFAEAAAAYEAVVALVPGHPGVLNNLGLALEGGGESERALVAYRAALKTESGHRQSLRNLTHLLCRLGRYPEAAVASDEYVRRYPDADATAWVDRGICQHHAGDYIAAGKSFERARSLAPDDPLVLTNLGSLFVDCEDFARAEAVLAQATARDESRLYARSLLALCRAHLCAWDGLQALHEDIEQRLESGADDVVNAFAALSMPLSPALQLKVARRWARDLNSTAAHGPSPHRTRGLRVGYVSSDFRTHPTASLLAEVWERHDRTRLTTYAYSIGPGERSSLRTRIEAAFDRFVDCSSDSIEQTVRRIAEDGIEVLIDLNGYTTHARSGIFALRPAPIQIGWLGYLGTLGADWYDYVLTDRFACPPESQRFFSERFLYLPDCYCPSDTRRAVASVAPSRAACRLPEQAFVFCCFNNTYKILPAVFDVWMRLLERAPGSVLWLAPANAIAAANLAREARARGVDPERLIVAPRTRSPEHLARHVHVDLFLDTTPYNAGATANDALFMGIPVLTCAGSTMASRVAGSQLSALGMSDLVTDNLSDYETLGLALASEPQRLHWMGERVRTNRETHPLFDMARFTRALDDLLCAAWENRSSRISG